MSIKNSEKKGSVKKQNVSVLGQLKKADSAVENAVFGNIAGKLRIISKVLLYIFMVIGVVGVVLTALLTSSLGGFGVIVALVFVAVIVFMGYGLSSFIYAYAKVVENSREGSEPKTVFVTAPAVEEKVEVAIDSEFPEF